MQYILRRGNSLHYQRAYPRQIQSLLGRAMYQRLQLNTKASDADIRAARDGLNQLFEQRVVAAKNSLHEEGGDPSAQAVMLNILHAQTRDQALTLNDLWQDYCQHKRLKGRDRQIADADWMRFIRLAGNLAANDDSDTNRRLNAALQAQYLTRQQHVKPSTAKRELTRVIAALKFGAQQHNLYWRIDALKAPKTDTHSKATLKPPIIRLIHAAIGNDTSSTDVDALLLLALTTGISPAEIARMRSNDLLLNATTPHLWVRNAKDQRYRIAPILVHKEFLHHSLPAATNLSKMSKGYVSRMCSQRLQAITGSDSASISLALNTFRAATADVDLTNQDIEQLYKELCARLTIS
ncbi:MAG: hypothetical protein RL336_1733 [Pseudomonadota bacterium]|jgi:hypothetical protein